jgi:ParB-like chromosome segregation protein Spo0J
MIVDGLKDLAHPIEALKTMPGNPRKGDVDAVKKSYARFGQRKPIVATADGTVIAGNHQLLAARSLGWSEIAVVFVDDDDKTAKAFALADNRVSDLGTYDDVALGRLLEEVSGHDDGLLGTGYTMSDVDALLGRDVLDEDEEPIEETLKPFERSHFLISVPISQHGFAFDVIREALEGVECEIRSSQN